MTTTSRKWLYDKQESKTLHLLIYQRANDHNGRRPTTLRQHYPQVERHLGASLRLARRNTSPGYRLSVYSEEAQGTGWNIGSHAILGNGDLRAKLPETLFHIPQTLTVRFKQIRRLVWVAIKQAESKKNCSTRRWRYSPRRSGFVKLGNAGYCTYLLAPIVEGVFIIVRYFVVLSATWELRKWVRVPGGLMHVIT